MSLIFEALKKLDREKQAPERGFLVVGGGSWAGGRRARAIPLALALAAAGVGGFFVAQWLGRRGGPSPAATPVQGAATPTPPPATFAPPYIPPIAANPAPPEPAAQGPRESAAVSIARGAAAQAAEVVYALQAVTEQDGQPVAIVNGQLVRVGDVVEGARVLSIRPDAVELEKDGRRIALGF